MRSLKPAEIVPGKHQDASSKKDRTAGILLVLYGDVRNPEIIGGNMGAGDRITSFAYGGLVYRQT